MIVRACFTMLLAVAPVTAVPVRAEVTPLETGGFRIHHTLTVPGSPASVYDAMTGDISSWWDHSFSGKPARFFIEPKPGGGFYEIFDDSGDGVLHATVTWAQRGKRLRFVGPLGLAGKALDMVVTWDYEAAGDSTRITCTCNAAGQLEEGWPDLIDGAWHHFLFEGLKPWIEAGGRDR